MSKPENTPDDAGRVVDDSGDVLVTYEGLCELEKQVTDLTIENAALREQVATLAKSAASYASEAVRLTHVVCDQTDNITMLEKQVAALERERDEAKRDEYLELQTISERDAAEDCIEKIYMEVTGDVLVWSSNFGCPEALDMVEQTMFTKQQELGSAMAELTAAQATIAELRAKIADKKDVNS